MKDCELNCLFHSNRQSNSLQCQQTETEPGDGFDNDCDGVIDEEDKNGRDDDGDGKIDEDLKLVTCLMHEVHVLTKRLALCLIAR